VRFQGKVLSRHAKDLGAFYLSPNRNGARTTGAALQIYDSRQSHQSLFGALLSARRRFGAQRIALVDGDERAVSYGELVRAALALGPSLVRGTKPGDCIGIMLPSGVGVIAAFFALLAYGRIPTMINFTTGTACLKASLTAAQVKRIITARRFIKLGKLEALEAALCEQNELLYLDELRDRLPFADKLAGLLATYAPRLVHRFLGIDTARDKPAVILFTSGSEAAPKGVVLSHANLLANVEQVRRHIDISSNDVVFNPLPTFHCFGLTVGALMPLYLGIKSVLHPSPRQPHEVVKRIHQHGATLLLATDTFVSQYARAGEGNELSSLRLAICGAERVQEETRAFLKSKHGVTILEGYGVTEASPVVSANQPNDNRPGTVGKLVHWLEARIEPVDGIADGGRLMLRGPNIMLGYLTPDRPGEIHPVPEGWHDTGDIVCMDADGYITIRGRLKRFAKIGGETVSLATSELCASMIWPNHNHAAIALRDSRKGEQIVLVSTAPEANRGAMIAAAPQLGINELAIPRRVIHVEEIPLLATGKTDYPSVTRMVLEQEEPQQVG
jgi:acyl-[acyl-carrier-protein]-phospholipid O-acyltransferase/long-chain-fatty-acid--[acyl-carrier-protein] ligase